MMTHPFRTLLIGATLTLALTGGLALAQPRGADQPRHPPTSSQGQGQDQGRMMNGMMGGEMMAQMNAMMGTCHAMMSRMQSQAGQQKG